MFIQPIRSIAVVVAVTLVSIMFVDISSAQLFRGRGGLFQRNRGGAGCCCPVSRCCPTAIASSTNQGYQPSGYGNTGYGNSGYGDSQSYPAYSDQSGQLLNGNTYNQGDANWQNSVQSSGQTGVNMNATGSEQQGTFGLQQAVTPQNSGGTLQTNPQVDSLEASSTEVTGEIDVNSSQANDGDGVDGNLQSDQNR